MNSYLGGFATVRQAWEVHLQPLSEVASLRLNRAAAGAIGILLYGSLIRLLHAVLSGYVFSVA